MRCQSAINPLPAFRDSITESITDFARKIYDGINNLQHSPLDGF